MWLACVPVSGGVTHPVTASKTRQVELIEHELQNLLWQLEKGAPASGNWSLVGHGAAARRRWRWWRRRAGIVLCRRVATLEDAYAYVG